MGRFDDTDFSGAQTTPAGPKGLGQTSKANQAAGQQALDAAGGGGRFDAPLYEEWGTFADQAQTWYTGANNVGIENGWATKFVEQSFTQQNAYIAKAQEAKDSTLFYDWLNVEKNPDATGLATWNDPRAGIEVGDVFRKGEKVGNLYKDFDEYTADLMLLEYKAGGVEKARLFESPDREAKVREAAKGYIEADEDLFTNTESQQRFADAVETRQQGLLEGQGDTALAAGAGVLTAGMTAGGAAALGASWTGPGAIAAGVAGFAVGAGAAWLNRDQLTEMTARASEVSALANQKYDGIQAAAYSVKEYSGVGMKLIAPLSNLTQGVTDAKLGTTGDGEAEFYAVDEDGNRKRPAWVQMADVAATLGDSVLQFASPVGVAAFTGTTGAHVLGASGALTTGAGFNDRSGEFDDYEGAKEWSAAVGNVGIDVLQLGFAGAIARAGQASRAAFTGVPTTSGITRRTLDGRVYRIDEASGAALSARNSLTLLAPSEAIRWVNTSWRARNRAALSGGAVGPDDFYKASVEMASGNHRLSNAIVNGWAEGAEEGVQAILEPTSFSASLSGYEIAEAFLYGSAAGAGMTLGRVSAPASSDEVLRHRADALRMRATGAPLSDEEWAGMNPGARKRAGLANPTEAAEVREVLDVLARATSTEAPAGARPSPLAEMALAEVRASRTARDLASANTGADNNLQLAGISGDKVYGPNGEMDDDVFSANTAVASARQTMINLQSLHQGLATQAQEITSLIEQAQGELAAATEAAADTTSIEQRIQSLSRDLAELGEVRKVASVIGGRVAELYEQYRVATTMQDAYALIDEINELLDSAFTGRFADENGELFGPEMQEFARRAVEMKFARYPTMTRGSYAVLKPQISKAYSRAGNDGTVATHQSTLLAMGGDHDGDTVTTQSFLYVPSDQLTSLRLGSQYLENKVRVEEVGTDSKGEPITREVEYVELTIDPPDNEKAVIGQLAGAMGETNDALRSLANNAVDTLVAELSERYENTLDTDALHQLLRDFRTQVAQGNTDARMNLANGLFSLDTTAMLQMGADTSVPEALWLMQRISLEWQRFKVDAAALDDALVFTPADAVRDLNAEKAYQRSLAVQEMGNAGQTVAMLLSGNDPVRNSQHLWYSGFFRAAVAQVQGTLVPGQVQDFMELYIQLGSGVSQTENERVGGRSRVQKRALEWLEKTAAAMSESLGETDANALLLLAMTQVPDIQVLGDNQYSYASSTTTLLQLLMRRSIEIERAMHAPTIEADETLQLKLSKLERLTYIDAEDTARSTNAEAMVMEVMGGMQVWELLGDSAKYLGPQLTLNQLAESISDVTPEQRQRQIYRWRGAAPYVMHDTTSNPPYSAAQITSGALSPYRIVVDSVTAVANKAPRKRARDNERAKDTLRQGFENLHSTMDSYRRLNNERMAEASDIAVLEEMLTDPSLTKVIAGLVPDAARLGAFSQVGQQAYAAPWVMEVLTNRDVDKAMVQYVVYSKISEWKQLLGVVNPDPRTDDAPADKHPRAYRNIKSRILQTFAMAAATPDGGLEFSRLLRALKDAPSLTALEETLNSEPRWRGERAELLSMFDDVAEFETDPSEVWTSNLPGTLQREAITAFARKTRLLSTAMAAAAQERETEQLLLASMDHYLRTGKDRDQASSYVKKLEAALTNRVLYPDHLGPETRDQLTAKIQSGIARMHDKGKADDAIAPVGDYLVLADEFGVKQSVLQTVDALTVYDVESVLANPTKLAEGPVRVMLTDGSIVSIDMSTTRGALDALMDPTTNALAKRVLYPTSRDVNVVGALQTYADVAANLRDDQALGLKTALDNANLQDLFDADGKLSLRQAHKYISVLEAGIRRKAQGLSKEEQAKAFFPIQTLINELLVAYTAGPKRDDQDLRNTVYVEVAQALQALGALSPDNRDGRAELIEEIRTVVKETMRARLSKSDTGLVSRMDAEREKSADRLLLLDAYANTLGREAARLAQLLTDPDLSAEQRSAIIARRDELADIMEEQTNRLDLMSDTDTVLSVLNMFTPTGEGPADVERKGAILSFLGSFNRIDRFQGNYLLIDRVNYALAHTGFDPAGLDSISLEQWQELGTWAATGYLAELSGRAASTVDLTPLILGVEGEARRRAFDPSYSALADGLLSNPIVLDVAAEMSRSAGWKPTVTPTAVVKMLESGLLSRDRFGKWHELLVSHQQQARTLLASASVRLAIPTGGQLPPQMAAYVGASRRLAEPIRPSADMATTAEIVYDADRRQLVLDEQQFFKLNNHFAARAELILETPEGPQVLDLLDQAGQAWIGNASVRDSGYRVVKVADFNAAIDDILADSEGITGARVSIDYFDVDTMPSSTEWANNPYFEGVGRESVTGSSPALVGETFFAVGGVSQQSQQNPMNMATKGGAGYVATPVTPLATALNLESSVEGVGALLRAKANHVLSKKHDVELLSSDANSLFKLMKMRHVVAGTNAEGVRELWTVEQAMEWEATNGALISSPDFPLTGASVVPISDRTARTLLGEPGDQGLPGVQPVPSLDPASLSIQMDVSNERLAELGLERIGEPAELSNAALGSRLELTPQTSVGMRDKSGLSRYEQRIRVFKEHQIGPHMSRVAASKNSELSFKIGYINERNGLRLEQMLGMEALAPLFAKLKVPFADTRDMRELNITERLLTKLREVMSKYPTSVIWQHQHGSSVRPEEGLLSEIASDRDFENLPQHAWPTFEDSVVIDLESIEQAVGVGTEAYKTAQRAIKAYTKNGVTIVLSHGRGGATLRKDLADWMRSGSMGYGAVAESPHIFAPLNPDTMKSKSRQALESTLTATQAFTGDSLIAAFVTDEFDALSENAGFRDLRPEQPVVQGESITLLPTALAGTYGMPSQGSGQLDQRGRVRDQLTRMISDPRGREFLKEILGGDPEGVPLYSRRADGVAEPGIRSLDDALDRISDLLTANRWPVAEGEELMLGDIVPLLGRDGSLLLTRVGFKLPNREQLGEQLAKPFSGVEGDAPEKIAGAVPKLQSEWSVRPPARVMSVDPDHSTGTAVRVRYDLAPYGKTVFEGDGMKIVWSPMPEDLALPETPMADNGLRVNHVIGRKASESKQAVTGFVNNFEWAFAWAGVDFTADMERFLLGDVVPTAKQKADVMTFLENVSKMNTGFTPEMLADLLDTNSLFAVLGAQLNDAAAAVGGSVTLPDMTGAPRPASSVTDRIAQVVLATLMADGMTVDHVLGTSGLLGMSDLTRGFQARLMPKLLTDSLNDFGYPEVREELVRRINARVKKNPDGSQDYELLPDWTMRMRVTNPKTGSSRWVEGRLQIALQYEAAENPVNYVQSSIRNQRQGESQHVAFTAYETIGARTATERSIEVDLFDTEGVDKYLSSGDGGFWEMMRALPADAATWTPWKRRTPLQRAYFKKAYAKMKSYLEPLDREGWTPGEEAEVDALGSKILEKLFGGVGEKYRVELDYMARQMFGSPATQPGDPAGVGELSPSATKQAFELILDNVVNHRVPTYGGVVPLPHHTLLAAIKEANEGRPDAWAPRLKPGKKRSPLAKDWDEWVIATVAQMRESNTEFSPVFRTDLDGFWHTYDGTTEELSGLSISTDLQRDLKLMDPETNDFMISLDPNEAALMRHPIVLDTMNVTLDVLTGHDATVRTEDAYGTDASDMAKRIERIVAWQRGTGMVRQEKVKLKDYLVGGSEYIQASRDSHNFFHNATNLSVTMRLANPALWTSAVFEVYFRNILEEGTNLVMGTATGRLGAAMSRAGVSRFTPEELAAREALAHTLGRDDRFLAMIYKEMAYNTPVMQGRKKIGGALEKSAAWSARVFSDPHFGPRAHNIARRYIDAALEYLEMTDNSIDMQTFVSKMAKDPTWLETQFNSEAANPHQQGLNRVMQMRSMRQSVPAKMMMGTIANLEANPKFMAQSGAFLLKIPFLFTRFNSNAILTLMGLGGFDTMAAMLLDKRESKFVGRLQAMTRGETYDPAKHGHLDMGDIIDGFDLTRPFIRGAVTHTGLMAAGLMTGGLGLSGEDEESKRRRRLAHYLGVPYYADPRDLQNDFRHADALFLDWLPGPLESIFNVAPEHLEPGQVVDENGNVIVEKTGELVKEASTFDRFRSAAVPHWIFRQFLSPVVGIERFFSTGDLNQIKWGFADAYSAIPTSVARLWQEADMTADMLAEAAKEQEGLATPEAMGNVNQFLMNLVLVYERGLLENSFVNAIRNGSDKYNRNPWALPEVTATGEVVRDRMGNPERTGGLSTFRNEDGEVQQGYTSRGDWDARLHQVAENSFTAALGLSLFTGQWGQDSSFLRQNMVVSQKIINLPETSKAQAEAMLLSAMRGIGGIPSLTAEEVEKALKNQAQARGDWWQQPEIDAQVKQIMASQVAQVQGGLSLLDEAGNEVISKAGAKSVYKSLAAGAIQIGDPSLQGLSISPEMRAEISQEWQEELIQEGVDLGLDEATAKSRAKRLWYGDTYDGDPAAVGYGDLLRDDRIPFSTRVVYNQLNTTYAIGPDGKPWATPYGRTSIAQAFGIPVPHRTIQSEQGGLGVDIRGNVTDQVYGINTGLSALERVEESWEINEFEFLEELLEKAFSPSTPFSNSFGTGSGGGSGWKDFGSGWRNFGGSGWKNYGGGGYSGGGGSGYFTKMYALPNNVTPYASGAPFINTSNPIIRRAYVRRERVWAERGRLKQWQ